MYLDLFKENYSRSWITAAIMVAGVHILKRVTSPASHFRWSFSLLTTVCSLSWKSLFDLHTCAVHVLYLSYRTNRDEQIFIESRKSTYSRRSNLSFCVLENDTLQAYRLLFTVWVTESMGGLLSMSRPAPFITHGNLQITIKIT